MSNAFPVEPMIAALKAAGEATRLRVLALLGQAELTVKDLTAILGQSQPRISRHLKLLADAGLIDRYPEGAWVFYRLTEIRAGREAGARPPRARRPGDPVLARDRDRLAAIKREHAETAHRYFADNAGDWDTIRALHVAEDRVEAAILKAVGGRRFGSLLDLGTGTGRMLELLAPLYDRAVGIDASPSMLAVARANLDRAGIANAQVRLGDIYNLPLPRDAFDVVTIHQVLHYLDDPERALARGGARAPPRRPAADRRLRAARSRVPARGACASPSRLRRGPGAAMDRGARPRPRPGRRPARPAQQAQGDAVAGARPAHARRRQCGAGGGVMAFDAKRPSRLLGSDSDLKVSFEFFPPKTEAMEETLWKSIERLAPLGPSFVSVTYGAGGSTRERTHATVSRILKETPLTPAAHLTCVAATKGEVDDVVRAYRDAGVRHIVALRGDPEGGVGTAYAPHPERLRRAAPISSPASARSGDFEVSVAAYPEKHPESPSIDADIDMLKRKVDAGADRAITQFFFDNDLYEAYVEKVRAAGLDIPVVPGIVPVHNFTQVARFAARCGASVPDWLAHRFEGLDDDAATRQLVAAAVAAEQVLDLVDRGVTDFHFYTMNRADLVYAICHLLGMRPAKARSGGGCGVTRN